MLDRRSQMATTRCSTWSEQRTCGEVFQTLTPGYSVSSTWLTSGWVRKNRGRGGAGSHAAFSWLSHSVFTSLRACLAEDSQASGPLFRTCQSSSVRPMGAQGSEWERRRRLWRVGLTR
jgi:hypothetical protein